MARKAILEGGKRDEIIAAATTLFFTEGFESTSVRKVLKIVDGEVGMFYHYFSSKEELFDVVVDRFFRQYALDFEAMLKDVSTPEMFVDAFLPSYEESMAKYTSVKSNMHWTIRSALHERTVFSLIPAVEDLLTRFGYQGKYPLDTASAILIGSISGAVHSTSFETLNEAQKKALLLQMVKEFLA